MREVPLQATRGMIAPVPAAATPDAATPTANIQTSGLPTSRPASTAAGVASFTGAFAAQIGAPEGLQALDSPGGSDSADQSNLLGGAKTLPYPP